MGPSVHIIGPFGRMFDRRRMVVHLITEKIVYEVDSFLFSFFKLISFYEARKKD